MTKKEIKKLALDDLKRSGLDIKDFKKMELLPCDEETTNLYLKYNANSSSYLLPYFNINGKVHDPVFIRFRFLEDVLNSKGKIIRYSQPKGTGVKLYFPPCINWRKICKDTSITICITEGEKKSYKASKMGIPTIGLGGVNSFVNKITKELIEDFDDINLKDRKVLICYDNDLHSNDEVNKASYVLANKLFDRGANVVGKLLPFNPYQKIGLDDYFINNTLDEFNNLPEKEFSSVTSINKLNSELAYIKEVGKYYIFEDQLFCNKKLLVDTKYSNETIAGDRGEPVSVAHNWNSSKQRREHKRLTYKPGQPQVTEDNELNLWKGFGCTPEKGNIKPFLDVVNKVFDNDKEIIKWFLDWVAYPIQYPATKMLTGVLIQSVEQGTGKSSLGLAIGAMYGDNYTLVDDTQLHNNSFNEWAVNKQFILGDEVSGKDKRAESDKIKNLITRPTITINRKYMPSYTVPDCINYLFTSNHPDALSIEPEDRRLFVYRIKHGKGLTEKQGQELERFRNGKGKNYLLNYFINEYVISEKFDYRSRPPMTEAKLELITNSFTPTETFLNNLKENPDQVLVTLSGAMIEGDLYTTTDLIKIFELHHPKSLVTPRSMGIAINKIFDHSEKLVTSTLKGRQNLKAFRNVDKWSKSKSAERQEHYDSTRIANSRAKQKKRSKIK